MVLELTNNNHFKFGYNNKWFNFRESKNDIWNIDYGRCLREPLDFRSECIWTAKLIREKTDKKITILFSGGIDSEIVVRSFIEAGIKIDCLICDYCGYNNHDISYSLRFCKSHNILPKIKSLDVKRFWYDNVKKEKTGCVSPQFPVIMWISDQVNGYSIIGSGECLLKNENNSWVMYEQEKVASLYKYYLLNNKEGAPGFFQYTPELILSFLENNLIKDTINDKKFHSSYPIKPKVYKELWPDLIQRDKYNGFEKLQSLERIYRKKLEIMFPGGNSIFKTEYNRLIRKLAPVVVEEISKDEIMKFKIAYDVEGVSITNTPFKSDVKQSRYFVARVRGKIAGFTSFDILNDGRIYQHGALTLRNFRQMGINNILWEKKMKKIKEFATEDTELIAVNPSWIPGACIMRDKLQRIGFKIVGQRPDGAPILSAKFKEVSNEAIS